MFVCIFQTWVSAEEAKSDCRARISRTHNRTLSQTLLFPPSLHLMSPSPSPGAGSPSLSLPLSLSHVQEKMLSLDMSDLNDTVNPEVPSVTLLHLNAPLNPEDLNFVQKSSSFSIKPTREYQTYSCAKPCRCHPWCPGIPRPLPLPLASLSFYFSLSHEFSNIQWSEYLSWKR